MAVSPMARLLACPFCRELFDDREASRCPQCDLPLVPMERLPLSAEALEEEGTPHLPPEHRPLGTWFLGRGRGALLALAVAGAALFFMPWVELTHAHEVTLRGYDLARGNAPWLWGGAIGWFLLVPLLLSRRTVADLRGVRVIAATFSAMTLGEAAMLLLRPPAEHGYVSYGLEYTWGLYASAVVSAAAIAVAVRLGGRLEDLRDLPPEDAVSSGPKKRLLH